MPIPTRRTREVDLGQWNAQWRQTALYQEFMRSRGLSVDGRVTLSRRQQAELERAMAARGAPVPGGMHIDQGGNLNQKNRTTKRVALAVGIAAGAYFGGPALFSAFGGGAGTGAAAVGGPAGLGWTIPAAAGAKGAAVKTAAAAAPGLLSRLSRNPLVTGGLRWGEEFFNRWQESRAINARFEADLARQDARQRYYDRSLTIQEKEAADNLAWKKEQWADMYELDAAKHEFEVGRWGAEFEAGQQQAADRLNFEKALEEQKEAGRQPYRSVGVGGLRALSRGMGTGMPPVERIATPPTSARVRTPAPPPFQRRPPSGVPLRPLQPAEPNRPLPPPPPSDDEFERYV